MCSDRLAPAFWRNIQPPSSAYMCWRWRQYVANPSSGFVIFPTCRQHVSTTQYPIYCGLHASTLWCWLTRLYPYNYLSLCFKCQVSHLRMCCVQHWHRRTFRFHGTHLQWKAVMELSWVTKCHISPLKNGMVGNFIALTLSYQKPIPHWLPVQVMHCLCLLLLWNLALCGFMLDCCMKKHGNCNTWIPVWNKTAVFSSVDSCSWGQDFNEG